VNVKNKKALDVSGGKDNEGQNVIVWKRHNGANQRWKIVYLDKAEAVASKGLNSDFGFHIERPFYIVSKMPMKRVAEVVGGRNIVLKSLVRGRNTQQFYFDNSSKTIKSQQYKDRSFDIQNAGRSNNLQMWKTNARWF